MLYKFIYYNIIIKDTLMVEKHIKYYPFHTHTENYNIL